MEAAFRWSSVSEGRIDWQMGTLGSCIRYRMEKACRSQYRHEYVWPPEENGSVDSDLVNTLLKFFMGLLSTFVIGWLTFYLWFTTFFNFLPEGWLAALYFGFYVSVLLGLVIAPIGILFGWDRLTILLYGLAVAFLVFQFCCLVWFFWTDESSSSLAVKGSSNPFAESHFALTIVHFLVPVDANETPANPSGNPWHG
jgi:hypothetical protein